VEGLARLRAHQCRYGPGLYAGAAAGGLVLTPPQQTMLVLGPPRSGKSSTLVVPNVLAAPGAVIATSTKPELMEATAAARQALGGRCWLFDPSGTTPAPPGVTRVRWSPVAGASSWDQALLAARSLSGAARPGGRAGEHGHWVERAEAVVAPLLHAAALSGRGMADVQRWVLRHDLAAPSEALIGRGASRPADVLAGLRATEGRELSSIWSTAAGLLAAYRSDAALATADRPNLDPGRLARSTDTVFICAPAREQELLAPITVAFVEAAVTGAYQAHRAPDTRPLPLTLVLDEVANIAPLPSLPGLVAEGAGQGVLTLACLQDLAQARQRWGPVADGFASLFGTKVALPGIGDLATLELLSQLGGEVDVPTRSVSQGAWWSRQGAPHTSWSPRRQRRLPVDAVHHQPRGTALMISGPRPPAQVQLVPWQALVPFAAARWAPPVPSATSGSPSPGRPTPRRDPEPEPTAAWGPPAAPPPDPPTARPLATTAPRPTARRPPGAEVPVHEDDAPGHGVAPW
jgi:type IV secretion system protein VirD4